MTYTCQCTCPYCKKEFPVTELQMPGGAAYGAFCPCCKERVRVFYPYGAHAAILALLLAIGALRAVHVSSPLMFAAGVVFIWVPLSLYLKLMSARYAPPVLKCWELPTGKKRRRTFFEWLYDQNAPRDIFDKRP